ncbi:MAG TPA: hypothetical protein VEA69_14200 [Tepidisphaeraceae bacterium]|nr:hypothetical protein [Tepidisphaeraceae bacterium]
MTAARAPRHRPSARARALSLPEMLVSLAITATLLVAVGAALHASTRLIADTETFARGSQSARVAMAQMMAEVRRCDSIDPARMSATLLPILRPAETRPANEALRVYKYVPATKQLVLYFEYTSGGTSAEFPIAHDVQAAPFSWTTGADALGHTAVVRVTAALDVKVGTDHVRLSGSASPRRSLNN